MTKPHSPVSSSENSSSLPTTERRSEPQLRNSQSVFAYLNSEIEPNYSDIPIILCCLVAGLCDSSAYNAWSCFVSMQTGNTIFLALGASNQPSGKPYGWLKSLVSISSFLCGCFVFSNTRFIRPKARGTLATSFLIQSIFIIVSAALVQSKVVPAPVAMMLADGTVTNDGQVDLLQLLPLAFLAFQSGGQIVTSRILGFNEVPTTVLTSVYCDLASDPKILAKDNVKRNRRICAILLILIGGIMGGFIYKSSAGLAGALWVAAAIKLAIAMVWSFWKPKAPIQL